MNNNFIPKTAPDGSEKGERPADAPRDDWSGVLINEAAEITPQMWDSLKPQRVSTAVWCHELRAKVVVMVSEKITTEKRSKIFPLSWDRVQFLAEQSYQEWRAEAVRSRRPASGNPSGLSEDAVRDLIHGCEGSLRMRGVVHKIGWDLASKIVQAAYKRGAEEMQKVMEDRLQPGLSTSKRFWFRQQLEQIWCAPIGSPITDDMKRAARVAIQIVDGCKWDGTTWRPINIEKTQPSSQELQSQALGEQASLMGFDVVAAALVADVPLPIPPGSAIWPKIRPEMEERANPGAPGSFIESELRARASRGVGPGRLDDDFRERERAAWFEREADRAAALLGTSLFDPEPPAPGSVGTKPQQDGDRPLPCGNVPRA